MTRSLLLDVKENALDDGPGIRTVLFLKGCALSCAWCHNPESMRREVELSWDAAACAGGLGCLERCPEGALLAGPQRVDWDACTRCLDCVPGCETGALSQVGAPIDVRALVARVLRDKPFFDASGGGVTVSGGEPTLDLDLLGELLQALKEAGLRTLLQTCGTFARARFEALVWPWLDAVQVDLKLFDDAEHRRWCGASNRGILANVAWMVAQGDAVDVLPRVPLVPGITDTDANLTGLAGFLAEVGAERVQLVPFNPLWPDKLARIGAEARLHTDRR